MEIVKKFVSWNTCIALIFFSLQGCPTCIGTLAKDAPPFFSDDFYEVYQNNNFTVDYLTTLSH